jgi:hypothetical protein
VAVKKSARFGGLAIWVGSSHCSCPSLSRADLVWPSGCTELYIYIYIFSITILQKYMDRQNFCKTIHMSLLPMASGT